MNKQLRRSLSIVFWSLAAVAMLILLGGNVPEIEFSAPDLPEIELGTREAPYIVNGTANWTTGTKAYEYIRVENGGSLWIKPDSTVTVSHYIEVVGTGSKIKIESATVTVKGGRFSAICEGINIKDSNVRVYNATLPPQGADGYPSLIHWETRADKAVNIQIDGSTISCEATDGGDGVSGDGGHGGDGGGSTVIIYAGHSNYKVAITDSTITSQGGAGGKCGPGHAGNTGGTGGESKLQIDSLNAIELENVNIFSYGGEGGEKVGDGTGGPGGKSFSVWLKAQDVFSLRNTLEGSEDYISQLISRGGIAHNIMGTDDVIRGDSQIELASGKTMMINDNPPVDREMDMLTLIESSTLVIDAGEGASIYSAHCMNFKGKEVLPTARQADFGVDMYWWLTVIVQGSDGTPLEDADVAIEDSVTEIALTSDVTDEEGKVHFNILGFSLTTSSGSRSPKQYNVRVTLLEIEKSRTQYTVTTRQTEIFELKLIDITVMSIQGKTPPSPDWNVWPESVGGMVIVKGTSDPPPNSDTVITQAWATINGGGQESLVDTSLKEDFKPYSTWEYRWDTSYILTKQENTLELSATNGRFISTFKFNITVDQEAANHIPSVFSISLSTKNTIDGIPFILDNEDSDYTYINATLKDADFDSNILDKGTKIHYVEIFIEDETGTLVIPPMKLLTSSKYITYDDLVPDEWKLSYGWNTRKQVGEEFDFKDGNYTIYLRCADNGNLVSDNVSLSCRIYHQVKPKAAIRQVGIIEADGKIPVVAVTTSTITLNAPMGETFGKDDWMVTTVKFDATAALEQGLLFGSYDLNGYYYSHNKNDPLEWQKDLVFTWYFDDGSGATEGEAAIRHEYNTSKYDKEYSEFRSFTKDWNVRLVVEDKEGLKDSIILTIIVKFTPPPVPPEMPFVWVFNWSMPLHKPAFLGPLVGVLCLLNIIGLAVIMVRRQMLNGKAEKKKKALNAAARKRIMLAAKSQETTGFTGYKKAKAGAYSNVETVSDFSENDRSQFMISQQAAAAQREAEAQKIVEVPATEQITQGGPAMAAHPPSTTAPPATQPAVTTAPPATQPAVTTAPPATQPAVTTAPPATQPAVTTAPPATQPAATTTTAPAATTTAPATATTAPATTQPPK